MFEKDVRKKWANGKGKVAVIFAAMGFCVCMMAACGDAIQTEEELVIPKEQTEPVEEGEETKQTNRTNQSENAAAAGSVAEQVHAPERYQWETTEDSVHVTADAAIVVPDVEGIRTKKVTGRAFTQEDYDKISQVLLGGSELWERSNGPTVSELETKFEALEEAKRNGAKGDEPYADKEETLDEQIEMYREYARYAPTEPVIRKVPSVVAYDASLPEGEGNWLSGQATVDGRDCLVNVDNSLLTGDIRRAVFSIIDSNNAGSWNWLGEEITRMEDDGEVNDGLSTALKEMKLQPEAAMEEAEKVLKQAGLEEYAPCGGEYCFINSANEEGESSVKQVGYSVYCTRETEGVPVTYSHETGIAPEGALMWWPSEEIQFVYNDEGLASFEWVNPWKVEELSVDPVFLMPFAEIRDIFQEMIVKKSLDEFYEEGDSVEICVDKVRLGYMKVQEPGEENMEGTLIPVWDFFGSKTWRNAAGEIKYTFGIDYESLLTVNAMDGTLVER